MGDPLSSFQIIHVCFTALMTLMTFILGYVQYKAAKNEKTEQFNVACKEDIAKIDDRVNLLKNTVEIKFEHVVETLHEIKDDMKEIERKL